LKAANSDEGNAAVEAHGDYIEDMEKEEEQSSPFAVLKQLK